MSMLKGVADTLFIPLAARVFASKKYPEYFYDEKALSLEKHIPDDTIRKKSSEYSFMASVARYYNMDSMTGAFIAKHDTCNVIFLGAGLETAYLRLGGPAMPDVRFYEVDISEVIDVRRLMLGDHVNEKLIGCDIFNMAWSEQVDSSLPTLLIASGVFQYFTEDEVVKFIGDVQDVFTDAELIFDATNETGIRYANHYVKKTGNKDALMHFYVNDGKAFAQKSGAALIEERPFFTDARRMLAKKLGLYTRIAMKVADDKRSAILLHLKIQTCFLIPSGNKRRNTSYSVHGDGAL